MTTIETARMRRSSSNVLLALVLAVVVALLQVPLNVSAMLTSPVAMPPPETLSFWQWMTHPAAAWQQTARTRRGSLSSLNEYRDHARVWRLANGEATEDDKLFVEQRVKRARARDAHARGAPAASPVITGWLNQTLDHFAPSSTAGRTTWQQRYFVNPQYWNGTGPVIMLVGWEGAQEPGYIDGDYVVSAWAEQFGALLVDLEHRFYGASVPFNDQSPFNLQFLTSEQALSDANVFVQHINDEYGAHNVPWIAVGGSYSGNLAAWLRLRFPHQFVGAMAISGPQEAYLEYVGYMQVVDRVLPTQCYSYLRQASEKLTSLLSDPTNGWPQVAKDFNLCQPGLQSDLDASYLATGYFNTLGSIVQYAQPGDVDSFCKKFMSASDDPYTSLIQYFYTPSSACYNASYAQAAQLTGDGRSWTFQTCNEFAFFQTANYANSSFSPFINRAIYEVPCTDAFGVPPQETAASVNSSNRYYGGKRVYTTNTVFTNGANDPWSAAGILNGPAGLNNEVFVIANASHCNDIMPPKSTDWPALKQAYQLHVDTIATWITEFYENQQQ